MNRQLRAVLTALVIGIAAARSASAQFTETIFDSGIFENALPSQTYTFTGTGITHADRVGVRISAVGLSLSGSVSFEVNGRASHSYFVCGFVCLPITLGPIEIFDPAILGMAPDGQTFTLQLHAHDALIGQAELVLWQYDPEVVATPEPASLTLLATGLVGVAGARRRRKSNVDA